MAILWTERRMGTGVKEIDEQHQELIHHFNKFHEAMARGGDQTVAIGLLGFLADYTEKHFTCEEDCMRKFKCPAAGANLAAHNSLREEITRIRAQIKDNSLTLMDLVKIEQMLSAWIQNHLCTIDVQLRGCGSPSA